MARMITFTPAAVAALESAKSGQSKDMLTYLTKRWGTEEAVDQNRLAEDLMRKQFTPYEEGGVLSNPSPSSLVKIYELHKAAWTKANYLTAVNTEEPKPPKAPGKILTKMLAMEARIKELEGALAEALAALEAKKAA
jgi:hypothetical protein